VFIPAAAVRRRSVRVLDVLRRIPASARLAMRIRIIYEIMPALLYARPGCRLRDVDDAFLVSLRSLFARIAHRLSDDDDAAPNSSQSGS
jgi:hypothetical protein